MQEENVRKKLQMCIADMYIYCDNIRFQRISWGDTALPHIITELEELLKFQDMQGYFEAVMDFFSCFFMAYEAKDYILAADYMESGLIPILESAIAQLVQQLPQLDFLPGYEVEYTASGALTVAKQIENKKIYLHSNLCPQREAAKCAEQWMDQKTDTFYVAGFGMGYHIEPLSENPLMTVYVYEEDEQMLLLAEKFSDVWEVLQNRNHVHIIADKGYRKFVKEVQKIDENTSYSKIGIYHPSIRTIADGHLRSQMETLFLQLDNEERWKFNMNVNFRYNRMHILHSADELSERFREKTVYLVAGGPSLDKNIHLLKERKKDEIVLTVGTSLRRCIAEEIHPDFAIITDPKEMVAVQIEGIESCGVPLLLMSTAFRSLAENYQGDKYLLCQRGYVQAEQMAAENGWMLCETGGSVTTTALDFCIQMKAKRVVFLGLDLAFTGGKSHHGTLGLHMTAKAGLQVSDIYGNLVVTSKNLNLYRLWIEKRIEKAKKNGAKMEFIDASEGGARVLGTRVEKLQNIIGK
jgi:hypothetical protein